MGQGTSLLALAVVKKALHECKFEGCNVEVPYDEIKEHEDKCKWRLVRCPGSKCKAMIAFCTMIDHVGVCAGFVNKHPEELCHNAFRISIGLKEAMAEGPEGRGVNVYWQTKVHQLDGKLFFSMFAKIAGKYICDVVMGGTKEDCKNYIVKASVRDKDTGNSVYQSSFPPRPLSGQKEEAKFCLSVEQEAISEVRKYNKLHNCYSLAYKVQIKKL